MRHVPAFVVFNDLPTDLVSKMQDRARGTNVLLWQWLIRSWGADRLLGFKILQFLFLAVIIQRGPIFLRLPCRIRRLRFSWDLWFGRRGHIVGMRCAHLLHLNRPQGRV